MSGAHCRRLQVLFVLVRLQYRLGSIDVRAVEQRQRPSLPRSTAPLRPQTERLAAAGQAAPCSEWLAQRGTRTGGDGPMKARVAAIGARAGVDQTQLGLWCRLQTVLRRLLSVAGRSALGPEAMHMSKKSKKPVRRNVNSFILSQGRWKTRGAWPIAVSFSVGRG